MRTAFAVACAIFAAAAIFLFIKIPTSNPLVVFPELLTMLALAMPLLYWQSAADKKVGIRIAAIASCVIWVAGIAAAMIIKPTSYLVYIGDGLMLLGFLPLLYQWRFSWPWLVFGLLNFGIGVFLGAVNYIPDSLFPNDVLFAKHHLAEYHPAITWWVFGAFSLIFGMARLTKNVVKMARRGN